MDYRTVVKGENDACSQVSSKCSLKKLPPRWCHHQCCVLCLHWCRELKCRWYQGHSRSRNSTMQPLLPPKTTHLSQLSHQSNSVPRPSTFLHWVVDFPEFYMTDWLVKTSRSHTCFITGLNFCIKALDILLHQLNLSFPTQSPPEWLSWSYWLKYRASCPTGPKRIVSPASRVRMLVCMNQKQDVFLSRILPAD